MKQRTKWIATLSVILTLSALLFCLSLVNLRPTYATTGTADYTVVKDSEGTELGIRLNSPTSNGVKLQNKATSKDITTNGAVYEGLTFNLGQQVSMSDYKGILINFEKLGTGKNQTAIYLWLSQSGTQTIKRFNSSYGTDVTCVSSTEDALVSTGSNGDIKWSSRMFFQPGVSGTYNEAFTKFAGGNNITWFDQVVIMLDVTNTAKAVNNGVVIGDIAVYKEDATSETGYEVKTLFDADSIGISYDANDTTADFNLADLSKGTVVNNVKGGCLQAGSYVTDAAIRKWAQDRMVVSYYEDRIKVADTEKTVSIKYAADSAPDTSFDATSPAYSAFFTNVSFKLDKAYDLKNNYAGALIRISNPSSRVINFNHYYLSGSSVIRYSSQTAKVYKTFIDDNGVNLATSEKGVNFNGSAYAITAQTEGTWNIKFADELKSGFNNATAVQEIIFALRVDERIVAGDGIEIDSIAFYNADGVITEVYNSDKITATADAEENAGINIADETKGASVYVDTSKVVWTNRGDYYTIEDKKADCYAWALGKIDLGYTGVEIVVPEEPVIGTKTVYMDENGKLYKESAEGLTEVVLNIANRYGASIRFDAQTPGLRFAAEIGKDGYDALGELGLANVKFGMLIASTEFAGDSLDFNETKYFINKVIDKDLSLYLNELGTAVCYNVAVIGIPEAHYADTIIAQSYMEITYADGETEIVYGEIPEMIDGDTLASNIRSVKDVAQTLLDSGKTFSTEQLSILNKFIGA